MLVSMPRLSLQFGCLAIALLSPCVARAGECPSARSEIATDRPDVTNSSLVVPAGSIQSENGINTSRQSAGAAFDGSNSRLRFGVAPCLELLVDIPGYVGRLSGTLDTGFTNVTPAVKWQIGALPEATNLSVVVGAGGRYWAMWAPGTSDTFSQGCPCQTLPVRTERYGAFLQASYKLDGLK